MEPGAEPVVEHVQLRAEPSQHDAFVAAFVEARSLWLAARGCRSASLTRGSGDEVSDYRVRIEWRSNAERAAFAASDSASAIARAMTPFERRAHHVDTPIVGAGHEPALDPQALRRAFGHYPTGVAVITATSPDGPVGMVVSSFTSVSLRPPLVAFCAAHTSTTWPVIADARVCCINVLEASQGPLCHQLATRKEGRFESVAWSASPSGAPILTGVVGWLDCLIAEVRTAGDHDLVLLNVLGHDFAPEREPLLFHRSGYRTLASQTNVGGK